EMQFEGGVLHVEKSARSGDPIRDKDIGFVGDLGVAAGNPHQFCAVGTEHGESIKAFRVGNPLEVVALQIDGVEVEIAEASGGTHIGGKNDSLAVGKE